MDTGRRVGCGVAEGRWRCLLLLALVATATSCAAPPTPAPSTVPPATATGVDLSTWKLMLPRGLPGEPEHKSTSRLLAGYEGRSIDRLEDGSLVLWCPVTGVTTRNSSFPRTELRETDRSGHEREWQADDGVSTLEARLAVLQEPSKGGVVVGQILSGSPERRGPYLQLLYRRGRIEAKVFDGTPERVSATHLLRSKIGLNATWRYRIELSEERGLAIYIDDKLRYEEPVAQAWAEEPLFFKAGVYLQDNAGKKTEGGRARFYDLDVRHSWEG